MNFKHRNDTMKATSSLNAVISFFLFLILSMSQHSQAQTPGEMKPDAIIRTDFGDIKIRLYDDTPGHKANFLKLAQSGTYDSTTFHRIIKDFMIQGGDPNTKNAATRTMGGQGGPGYTQPAEIRPNHVHIKGTIAGARLGDQMNPKRESSGSQFYIVTGRVSSDAELDMMERNIANDMENSRFKTWLSEPAQNWVREIDFRKLQQENPDSVNRLNQKISAEYYQKFPKMEFKYTPEQRQAYKTMGGAPHLDMQYTVFGEVIEGWDVLNKIGTVPTQPGDRPVNDVFMKVILP